MINQEHPENAEYFNYFGSMMTNYARYTSEINPGFQQTSSIQQEQYSFHQKTEEI
jgi:hypothetical protein